MAGHAQLKFVMTECSKTQIRLMGLVLKFILNHKPLFRDTDLNLNNVWATGFEDSAELRASDVKSPLPFATHLHSTPNYWHEKQDKQQNRHLNDQQLNQSIIPNISQNAKVDNRCVDERDETGFELFSPLSAPFMGPRHRLSERNSISSYTSQSSQQSSDTDSFMELQGITDNMENCNLYNNNYMYMYESQIANHLSSTTKSAFQPCTNNAKSSQNSFSQNGLTSYQQNNLRKIDQGLSNFLAKRAMSFDAQKRHLIEDNSPRQNEILQNSVNSVNSKLANNINMMNSPKVSAFQNDIQQNFNAKSGFRPIVNPKTDFPAVHTPDNLENVVTNASFQNPPPVDMRPEIKTMAPVNSVQNGRTSNCVQNQTVSTPVSTLPKPQELKPVNANIFQPVRVLTRPQTTSSMSTSDQGWSNPSTPGSVTDSVVSHSDKASAEITVTQPVNQKPINFVPISVASKVTPPMYRHSFPLGIRPRFAPMQVDPHLVPVNPKFLLEPVQDKRYSMPNLVRHEQVMTEMMGSPHSLERNEERPMAPVQAVPTHPPPPHLVKYPAKIPLFVPAGIPQLPIPGNVHVLFSSFYRMLYKQIFQRKEMHSF